MIQYLQQAHVIIQVPHLLPGGSHHEQSVHAALQLQKVITCAMSINNSKASLYTASFDQKGSIFSKTIKGAFMKNGLSRVF